MTAYLIKSALCLALMYGFYYVFLRNRKIYTFNRFFLIFSLLFSAVVPLLKLRLSFKLPINLDALVFANTSGIAVQNGNLPNQYVSEGSTVNPIWNVYLLVAAILFLRFVVNLYRIVRQVAKSETVSHGEFKLVLIDEQMLPYSFFKYIFLNRADYMEGAIEKDLIRHEQAHGRQWHSLDILLVELARIGFWFNPFIWFLGRAVQLNHEYLADEAVLSNQDLSTYQKVLLQVVFRNNSIYLASKFTYSFIKKRLIMMQKKNFRSSTLRKLMTLPLVIFLGLLVVQAQIVPKIETKPSTTKVTKNKKYVVDKNGHKVWVSTKKFTAPVMHRSKAVSKRNRKPKGKKVKYTVKFSEPRIVSDSASTNSVSTKK